MSSWELQKLWRYITRKDKLWKKSGESAAISAKKYNRLISTPCHSFQKLIQSKTEWAFPSGKKSLSSVGILFFEEKGNGRFGHRCEASLSNHTEVISSIHSSPAFIIFYSSIPKAQETSLMEAVDEYLPRILSNRHSVRTAMATENRAQYIFFTALFNPFVAIYRNHLLKRV